MDLTILVTSFLLILATEMGDKTMLTSLALASKYPRQQVFAGTLLALTLLSCVGILVGGALVEVMPRTILKVGAGILFLATGTYILLKRRGGGIQPRITAGRHGGLIAAFSMISLMELGDKSQLAIIALTMETGDGLPVLIGAMLAFSLITAIGVAVGSELGRRIREDLVNTITGLLFIAIGLVILLEVAL